MNDHLLTPKSSFWPVLLAMAILLIAVGVVSNYGVSAFGLLLLFAAIIGWTWENRAEGEEEMDE